LTEIRPIRADEADAFLETLCQVFGLDSNRAYDIFFSEPYFDVNRKWALFEGREMVSILTTTPLQFGWGKAIGIAGVATRENRRSEGHATRLMERVLREAERAGEGPALLFARETTVYERCGFEPLDRVIRAPLKVSVPNPDSPPMDNAEVRPIYDRWAQADPNRLVRDAKRWEYWNWHYRVCEAWGGGYLLHEPSELREALYHRDSGPPPLPQDTEWFGLTAMADLLGYQFERATVELYLMGRSFPAVPLMFMTDQF